MKTIGCKRGMLAAFSVCTLAVDVQKAKKEK